MNAEKFVPLSNFVVIAVIGALPLMKKQTTKNLSALYEPTDAEKQSMKVWDKYRLALPPLPKMKVEQTGGSANIGPEHEDLGTGTALQMSAIGSAIRGILLRHPERHRQHSHHQTPGQCREDGLSDGDGRGYQTS